MPINHRPDPFGSRIVGGALGEHDGPPRGQAADDLPRAHDPAQVGHPEESVILLHVDLVRSFLGNLDQESAVYVDRPLGTSRRP